MTNLEKLLEGANWEKVQGWPHLEYPWKEGGSDGVIRWPQEYIGRAQMPMWRCARCKNFVNLEEPGHMWDTHTPCQDTICKAWFVLRWPHKAGGWINESS